MEMEKALGTFQQDDHEIIERLRRGDSRAVDEVVEKYKRQLFAFILRMIENHATAEDVFQETWMRVIRSIGNFRGESRFSTWLFQIALNLCRDSLRKSRRDCFVPLEEAELGQCDPGVDPIRMLQAEQVRRIVDELPVKMREVVVLRYFHNMSDREISVIAGCPIGTVKTRFHRAIKILSKKWKLRNRQVNGERMIHGSVR